MIVFIVFAACTPASRPLRPGPELEAILDQHPPEEPQEVHEVQPDDLDPLVPLAV